MRVIEINKIKSFGNWDFESPITECISGSIDSIKTIKDGIWVSWNNGEDPSFNGINDFNKGYGYLANGKGSINLGDNKINPKLIPVKDNTLCFIAVPYDKYKAGETPLFTTSKVVTLDDTGNYVSWVEGEDDEFQGFSNYSIDNGYIVDVLKVKELKDDADIDGSDDSVNIGSNNDTILPLAMNLGRSVEYMGLDDFNYENKNLRILFYSNNIQYQM